MKTYLFEIDDDDIRGCDNVILPLWNEEKYKDNVGDLIVLNNIEYKIIEVKGGYMKAEKIKE